MEIPYKESYENGLFKYVFVSGHHCYNERACRKEYEVLQKNINKRELLDEKDFLLGYINHLIASRKVILHSRFSPDLAESIEAYSDVKWEYYFYSNDFTGTAVDKGFIKTPHENIAGTIDDLSNYIHHIPESAFGDNSSHVSIFGMNRKENINLILDSLKTEAKPELQDILNEEDMFIHLSLAKEYGYFDSLLIKSKRKLPALV